jgi:hypothetical protein
MGYANCLYSATALWSLILGGPAAVAAWLACDWALAEPWQRNTFPGPGPLSASGPWRPGQGYGRTEWVNAFGVSPVDEGFMRIVLVVFPEVHLQILVRLVQRHAPHPGHLAGDVPFPTRELGGASLAAGSHHLREQERVIFVRDRLRGARQRVPQRWARGGDFVVATLLCGQEGLRCHHLSRRWQQVLR